MWKDGKKDFKFKKCFYNALTQLVFNSDRINETPRKLGNHTMIIKWDMPETINEWML